MIRDMKKYEEQGKQLMIASKWKRDLCVGEVKQIASAGDTYKIISMAFYAGVKIGSRLGQSK